MWTGDLQLMTPGYRKERRGVERTNQIENSGRSEDGREGEGGGALFKYLITSRRRMMNYLNTPPRPRGPESKNMFCCKKRHELKHTSVSTSFNTHTHTHSSCRHPQIIYIFVSEHSTVEGLMCSRLFHW